MITVMLGRVLQWFDEALIPVDDDLLLAMGDGHAAVGDDEPSCLAGAAELD